MSINFDFISLHTMYEKIESLFYYYAHLRNIFRIIMLYFASEHMSDLSWTSSSAMVPRERSLHCYSDSHFWKPAWNSFGLFDHADGRSKSQEFG